jgi:DSF synthase
MNLSEMLNLEMPKKSTYGTRNSQFELEFERESGTIWAWFNPTGTPCFSLGLLNDIRAHDSMLEANKGCVPQDDTLHKASYYVVGSRIPRVFNLGGDLALFILLIKSREREALAHYARLCIDNIYPRIVNYGCPTMTTISLVQGDALGGGFETALSSDVIVAEESAQLGLPEILFNLFPGMGAYSLLARRIGMRAAEDLITSGRILPATKLHEMGVIDVLAKDGEGESAVRHWIAKNQKRRNGFQAVFQARQHVHPITREELDRITDVWVDAALRLEDRDLKMMSRIVRSQMRRMDGFAADAAQAPQAALAAAG